MNKKNHYIIEQFFIDKTFNEKNLAVGFAYASTGVEAIDQYLKETYPGNLEKQDFQRSYLTAYATFSENTKDEVLLKIIEKNKTELGIFK